MLAHASCFGDAATPEAPSMSEATSTPALTAAAPEVRTGEYRYHAWLPGPPRRDLFRYDNCHGGLDTLHRHGYGPDGRELDPQPVTHADLPA